MRKIQVDDHAKPYMSQLNGLRAFAVGAVRLHHFSGRTRRVKSIWRPWVCGFFVLSRFLITLMSDRCILEFSGEILEDTLGSNLSLEPIWGLERL
jgi:peptidoglycan/LPS O-acetylase OafA/YrhL